MACYLIAGASGYVGSRLAKRLLAQGHRVRGLVRNPESDIVERLAWNGMVVWTGDITRPETLIGVADGVDVVYNLTSHLVLDNDSVRRTYVEGNRNLIAACSRARSVRAFVFTSNSAPYGDCGSQTVTEDTSVAPVYPLGDVMVATEQAILEQVRRHNFPAIILRCGTIYGPDRDFVDAVLKSTVTIFDGGRNYVPLIHVDDLLSVLDLVVTHGEPGAIYNVADDNPPRLIDLYTDVRERLGMLPPRSYSSATALRSGLDPNIVGRSTASVMMSNERLKHDLGIELRYPSYQAWLDERLGVEQALELAV